MDSRNLILSLANERGWTKSTVIDLLCRFMNDAVDGGDIEFSDFEEFLEGVVSDEDDVSYESSDSVTGCGDK